ncbi:leucine-rich repeat protein [Ruminococcus sp.]|uniref:leucine-rich repeat protein n=1 Tax=Ruminococcus sp. TaxID=41978 RepID=UPI0025ED7197|nr:leucine-rich repeat protein [Ruminococcus sp.]MCR4639631.1 leucine-rich repeat protein [Ruminococcus sp.]
MNFKRASLLAAAAAMLMSISGVLPVSERIPAIEASAAETALSGTCGKSASWELAGDGTLTISGTGDMYGLNSQAAPSWTEQKEKIKKVIIGSGITSVGAQCFSECPNLVSVTLSDTVTSIGTYAFSGCMALRSVNFPDSVTSIGSSAFAMCRALEEVSIPSSVNNIGSLAFSGTAWLNNEVEKTDYVIVNGMLIFTADIEEAAVPDTVTNIISNSFWGHTSLKKVTIPETVTQIGYSAFSGCSSLTAVTIPASVEDIGMQAFTNCAALEEVTILNPNAEIFDRATTFANNYKDYSGAIKGYDDSTAEAYAKKYGYSFKSLGKAPAPVSDKLGDVNSDGYINAVDASEVLTYYAKVSTKQEGGFTAQQIKAADTDGNGLVNAVDASAILSYYAYTSTAAGEIIPFEDYIKQM